MDVLIVEDEALQRRALAGWLHGLGATVREAADGLAALEILEHAKVDLVISDLGMPGLDGLELLCAVGERGYPVAFALYSAMDREIMTCMELMARERRLRFLGALTKPASIEELARLLERAQAAAPTSGYNPPIVGLDELLGGLERREFVPHFQPKVRFSNGFVVGIEALARWQHPTHGLLGPGRFLPALEAANLLGPLTLAILTGVLDVAKTLARDGQVVPVAINLPLSYLSERGAAAAISEAVSRSSVATELIAFEITEQVAMTDVGTCLENIARLRLRGHRFAIDDFGVGYSSLVQLVRIPASELKIDRSFVSGVVPGSRAASLLRATIALAHELDLATVAEGIETASDWKFLADLGCDVAQGYFIARPLPPDQLGSWLRRSGTVPVLS